MYVVNVIAKTFIVTLFIKNLIIKLVIGLTLFKDENQIHTIHII